MCVGSFNPVNWFFRIIRDAFLFLIFLAILAGMLVGYRCLVAYISVSIHDGDISSEEELSDLLSWGELTSLLSSIDFSSLSSDEEERIWHAIKSHDMWDWTIASYWIWAAFLTGITMAILFIPVCIFCGTCRLIGLSLKIPGYLCKQLFEWIKFKIGECFRRMREKRFDYDDDNDGRVYYYENSSSTTPDGAWGYEMTEVAPSKKKKKKKSNQKFGMSIEADYNGNEPPLIASIEEGRSNSKGASWNMW